MKDLQEKKRRGFQCKNSRTFLNNILNLKKDIHSRGRILVVFFFKTMNLKIITRLLLRPRVIILHFCKLTVTRVLGVATYPREVTIHPGVNTRVARPRASFAPRYNSCELDTPQIVDLSIEQSLDEI